MFGYVVVIAVVEQFMFLHMHTTVVRVIEIFSDNG